MKKTVILSFMAGAMLAASVGLFGGCSKTDANSDVRKNVLDDIRKTGVLRVAVESEAPPFNYINEETGETEGFEFELISLVAKEMGIDRVTPVWTDDYEAIPEMISKSQNLADIFMGGYVASDKIPNVVWSNPYYEGGGYCLIVPSESTISGLNDLTGKKIGIYNEDAAEEFVRANVSAPQAVNRFEDEDGDGAWMMKRLLDAPASERVDAIIYDCVFAYVEITKSDGKLKIVASGLHRLPYQIGLPAKNDDLKKEIDAALKKVMDSPAYAQLVTKYLDFNP